MYERTSWWESEKIQRRNLFLCCGGIGGWEAPYRWGTVWEKTRGHEAAPHRGLKPLCCSPSKVRPRNSVGKRPCGGGIGGWETPQELCPKLFWTPFFCLIGSKHVKIFCQKHVNEHVVEWNRTCFCDFFPVRKSQHGLETPHFFPVGKSQHGLETPHYFLVGNGFWPYPKNLRKHKGVS